MEINQLNYLLETIKTKSVSRTAANYNISQSAVSKSLKALENELHLPLFERDFSGMSLTEEASQLLPNFIELKRKIDILSVEIGRHSLFLNNSHSEQINVFFAPSISQDFSSNVFWDLLQKNTNLYIIYNNNDIENVVDIIKEGIIDMAFFLNINHFNLSDLADAILAYKPIIEQKLYLLVSHNSPLAQKTTVKFQDLIHEKLIIPNFGFNPQKYLRQILRLSFDLNIFMKCDNSTIIKKLVEEDLAVAVVSTSSASDYMQHKDIKAVLVEDDYYAEIGCLYSMENSRQNIINLVLAQDIW